MWFRNLGVAVLLFAALAVAGPVAGNSGEVVGADTAAEFWRVRGLTAGASALPDPNDPTLDAWDLERIARNAIVAGDIKLDYRALSYAPDLLSHDTTVRLLRTIRLEELEYGELELDWWRQQGLGQDQAVHRLQLEALASVLGFAFQRHDPAFTSLTIDPTTSFISVLRADGAPSPLVDAVQTSDIGASVRFSHAKFALSDLQHEIERIVDYLEANAIKRDFGMWIEPASGRLIIEFEEATDLREVDAARVLAFVEPQYHDVVEFRTVSGKTMPAATLLGGLQISNSGSCEMAFAVSGVIGTGTTTTGIVTAAHCGDSGQYPAGNALPFVREYGQDEGRDETDAQFHTKGVGNTVDNRLRYTAEGSPPGTLYVDITSRTGWAGQVAPLTVCHNGTSTNVVTCGAIQTNTYTPTSVVSADPEWVRVVMRACFGDSGASIWRNNSAYGILHGVSGATVGTCPNGQERRERTIYGAITFAEGRIQVIVLTS